MPVLETEITINAAPQTVWGIMDNLDRYPEWCKLVPDLQGKTIVGEVVTGTLKQPNTPDIPLSPTLTRIVGARELRWLSEAPEPGVFRGEHVFVLTPQGNGQKTHLSHFEIFEGAAVEEMWDGIKINGRAAYEEFNADLKARAEAMEQADVEIHPSVGCDATADAPESFTLSCACSSAMIEIEVQAPIRHNHLCGCSQCWKPDGALLAEIAVVPAGSATVTKGGEKLVAADKTQSVQRYACRDCGTHMIGRVPDVDHHFYGLEFIHPALSDKPQPGPAFAGFVSSVIETGTDPSSMVAIRQTLSAAGIPAYDSFSPELMDLIAWHKRKKT
ncbi:MAG: SRPBCC family protein [Pseudooceanicola sp.]